MSTQAGQHRPETRKAELVFWEDHGGVAQYDLHLPTYQRLFPFRQIDFASCRVLDVGSGPISVFERVAPAGAQVTAYDTLATDYNRIAPDKKFRVMDTLDDGSFDLITLFNMLDHMDDPASLLAFLAPRLDERGRIWIFVHIDRPFSENEHPQKFRFWKLPPFLQQFFGIENAGLAREGNFVYGWWGILRKRRDGAVTRLVKTVYFTAKAALFYGWFHGRRAYAKLMKVAGLRAMLPKELQF
jgi:SAM-dependent methyltransferase